MNDAISGPHLPSAEVIPVLPERLRRRITAPLSRTTRGTLAFGGVLLPVLCHLVLWTAPLGAPSWQSGELHDMLAFTLMPQAGYVLYPLLLYAITSLALYLCDEKRCSAKFWVRLGIWGGTLVALWYCVMFAATVAQLDLDHPVRLGWFMVVTAIQLGLLLLLWGLCLLVGWACGRLGGRRPAAIFALASVGAVALAFSEALIPGSLIAVLLFLFWVPVLIGLFSAPAWALLCYGFVSARLVLIESTARRFSLLQVMAAITWLATFLAACRWSILLSLREYAQLPVQPPSGCYVATAAAAGHRRLVGSSLLPSQHGRVPVNRQLRVLKALELLLQNLTPGAARRLRRIYDAIGPRLAQRIANPWAADLAYLTLKPLEWIAAALLWCSLGRQRQLVDQLFTGPAAAPQAQQGDPASLDQTGHARRARTEK